VQGNNKMFDYQRFDQDFENSRRLVNFMIKAAIAFIAVVFCCIVAFWIIVSSYAINTSMQIEKTGLKSVVESIWCGENKQCLGK